MKQVVIGLGFGDEGKGLVTDWLCSKNPSSVVTRYSGGHQAGHCVTLDGNKHIFSNFGSGTLRGIPTNWEAKTFDPVAFMNELDVLNKMGAYPVIYVDPKCPITTPFEKVRNRLRSEKSGHGSVGVGFSDTLRREEANYHLYFGDLYYPEVFKMKLYSILDYYEKNDIKISDDAYQLFVESCQSAIYKVRKSRIKSECEIYESSQGLLLDRDYGFFPYVTYARVGTQEIEVNDDTEYFLVTRAYQTRHGYGPNSKIELTPNNPNETNVTNHFQKEFRTTLLDLDMLSYAVNVDENIRTSNRKNLVITCMDQMPYFSVIHNGYVKLFSNVELFVTFILNKISFVGKVFISYGPEATDIIELD